MRNLEFHVLDRIFPSFDKALSYAFMHSLHKEESVFIDVICWDRKAAVKFGIEESYDEDPEASASDRIEIKAIDHGRIY